MRRLIVSGGIRPRELVLVDTLIVGRDPACDITDLNDPLLSRRHAAFTSDRQDAAVRDLDSRNGILVNGAKMKEARLRHGDVVQIGHLQVKFVDESGPMVDLPMADDAAATAITDDAATRLVDARLDGPTIAADAAMTQKLPS